MIRLLALAAALAAADPCADPPRARPADSRVPGPSKEACPEGAPSPRVLRYAESPEDDCGWLHRRVAIAARRQFQHELDKAKEVPEAWKKEGWKARIMAQLWERRGEAEAVCAANRALSLCDDKKKEAFLKKLLREDDRVLRPLSRLAAAYRAAQAACRGEPSPARAARLRREAERLAKARAELFGDPGAGSGRPDRLKALYMDYEAPALSISSLEAWRDAVDAWVGALPPEPAGR